jgi:hypothetical protein
VGDCQRGFGRVSTANTVILQLLWVLLILFRAVAKDDVVQGFCDLLLVPDAEIQKVRIFTVN